MYVLLIEISAYTSAQLFLGLFSGLTQAKAAHQALQSVATDNPWRLQAYRTTRVPDAVVIHQVRGSESQREQPEVLLVSVNRRKWVNSPIGTKVDQVPFGLYPTSATYLPRKRREESTTLLLRPSKKLLDGCDAAEHIQILRTV